MRRAVGAGIVAMGLLAACSSGSAKSAGGSAPSSAAAPTTVALARSTVVPRSTWPGSGAFVGPERLVPVGPVMVGYRQFGAGPDLVLLEGEEMTMTEWPLSLLRDLAAHYRVTMFDWRGVDKSTDDPAESYSIAGLADDTAGFFDAIGLHTPAVYGLSTGGEVGLALAVRHPDHVGKLMVSGATTGGPQTVPTPLAVNKIFVDPNANPVALVGLLFPAGDAADSNGYLAEILKVPQTLASAAVTKRQNAAEDAFMRGKGLAAGLRVLHTPVLVMNGAKDQLVPVENARRIAALIPGAQLHIFPDAGHMLIYQDRAQFVALIRKFTGSN
jgi:pimeloyl-ACP methyl ester carboxylesterase